VGEEEECTEHSTRNSKELEKGKRRVYQQLQIKSQKTNSSTRTTLQFLNFPFPPPLPPHTKNKNSAETNNQITTQNNVATTAKKERGKKKTVLKFCLEKSLCFSHRQRQQSQSRAEKRTH
jgi:hypothetical protein